MYIPQSKCPILQLVHVNDITSHQRNFYLLMTHGRDQAETAMILNRDLERLNDWAKKSKEITTLEEA